MIQVMPAPLRETNERGEWIDRERFRLVEERFIESLRVFGGQLNDAAATIRTAAVKIGSFTRCVESGGRVSVGARAVHIRFKALRRESRRYPTITLNLTGIL